MKHHAGRYRQGSGQERRRLFANRVQIDNILFAMRGP